MTVMHLKPLCLHYSLFGMTPSSQPTTTRTLAKQMDGFAGGALVASSPSMLQEFYFIASG
jgi:hypothetical protein